PPSCGDHHEKHRVITRPGRRRPAVGLRLRSHRAQRLRPRRRLRSLPQFWLHVAAGHRQGRLQHAAHRTPEVRHPRADGNARLHLRGTVARPAGQFQRQIAAEDRSHAGAAGPVLRLPGRLLRRLARLRLGQRRLPVHRGHPQHRPGRCPAQAARLGRRERGRHRRPGPGLVRAERRRQRGAGVRPLSVPRRQRRAAATLAGQMTGKATSRRRPAAPAYDTVALVLQGGGALGSYQAGVYQGLHEAGIRPNWLAGISIGAINAAIIAGSPPDERVERLRGFWESICRPTGFSALPWGDALAGMFQGIPFGFGSPAMNGQLAAFHALMSGQPGFFKPRYPPPYWLHGGGPAATSFYDTTPLADTLRRYVDFDLLNKGGVRASFGAVNVRTGNFAYFDSTRTELRVEHIMASGALPPGFPAVEIDGDYYWDGGVVSNTPLAHVLSVHPMADTLAFQVDLWPACGPLPTNLEEVAERQKDIQYSSRTRTVTNNFQRVLKLRRSLQRLLERLPEHER